MESFISRQPVQKGHADLVDTDALKAHFSLTRVQSIIAFIFQKHKGSLEKFFTKQKYFKSGPNLKDSRTTKTEIPFGMDRKHHGKRSKCWLPAFFPFPTMFSKGFFFQVAKSQDFVVKG